MWRFVGEPRGDAREDYAAVLSALLRLSGTSAMSTMRDITAQMSRDGYGGPMPAELLRERLDELVQMRLVLVFLSPTAAREELRDGHRRQEAWALSKKGRIIVRSVRDAINDLDRVLALPPRLIDSIQETLRQLLLHLHTDPMRLATDITAVRSHVGQLLNAAGDYYEAMRMLNQHDVTDDEVFGESRTRIMLVLRQFVQHTQTALAPLRSSLDDVRLEDYAVIAEAASAGAGAVVGDTTAWVADAVTHLESLDAWFVRGGNIDKIIESAFYAIDALLSAITRRYYAANRSSDLAADFRQLACMIHAQGDSADAYTVFAAATGLWAAQHPHAVGDEDDVLPTVPAAHASGADVTVSLGRRPAATKSPRAGARQMENLTLTRQAEEQAAIAEMTRLADLSAGLVTPGFVALDFFTGIDPEHLEILVELLEEAMDSFDPELGYGEALTLRCRLRIAVGQPGKTCRIAVGDGALTAPDMRIEIAAITAEPLSVGVR
ncbi:DUF2397 family protein [Actinoplanes sp. NPDC051475]|uniref:DUF2397 family protein n=1 Tax=Actinoplanes sp. NPDC051475 TaxID=3157225 RepID=UPI003450D2E3